MENLKPKVEMPPEWKKNQQKRQKRISRNVSVRFQRVV